MAIHEIVEIRLLQAKGIDPLKLDTDTLQLTLASNIDTHIQAIHDEHSYLQEYISREYKQFFQIGTLLKVNRRDVTEKDLQLLLHSDIGVVIVEDDKLEDARRMDFYRRNTDGSGPFEHRESEHAIASQPSVRAIIEAVEGG